MKPRYYQTEANDATLNFWEAGRGNGVIILPTGTGKAFCIADLIDRCIKLDPYVKIINCIHTRELVKQNAEELHGIASHLDIGIFSAGLKKKQRSSQITFGSIQSIYKHAFDFGKVDILLVDECQMIPKEQRGMWHTFIGELRISNPDLVIVGYTATNFRMQEGGLHEGDDALFDDIIYEYTIIQAIEDGYLSPLTNKPTDTHIDTSGVKKVAGEFNQRQLQEATNVDSITRACINEAVKVGATRKKWLVNCVGIEHAVAVRDIIREHGISCETINGKLSDTERDDIMQRYKHGNLKAVTHVNVMNTGVNVPQIDFIVNLMDTKSPVKWVQGIGRGTRPIYAPGFDLETREGRRAAIAAGTKPNLLIQDFTDCTSYFGPIDKITVKDRRGSGNGTAPSKMCPTCFEIVPSSMMVCPNCQTQFPGSDGPDLNRKAATDALLSNQIKPELLKVSNVSYVKHEKEGKIPTLRVDYRCGLIVVSEWVCIQHEAGSYPQRKAKAWWSKRNAGTVESIDAVLTRCDELRSPKGIWTRQNGKFKEIVGYEW